MYLRKAGTLILGASVCMWALTSYPKPPAGALAATEGASRASALDYSIAGRIGKALEPVTRPLGFDGRVNTAMIGAFAAKEVFVADMGIVFSLGESEEFQAAGGPHAKLQLRERLREAYTPLQGVSIMLFCLLGFPCMATVAVMCSESGSWRWMLLQWGGLTVFAYTVCLLVYQVGRLAGLGTR